MVSSLSFLFPLSIYFSCSPPWCTLEGWISNMTDGWGDAWGGGGASLMSTVSWMELMKAVGGGLIISLQMDILTRFEVAGLLPLIIHPSTQQGGLQPALWAEVDLPSIHSQVLLAMQGGSQVAQPRIWSIKEESVTDILRIATLYMKGNAWLEPPFVFKSAAGDLDTSLRGGTAPSSIRVMEKSRNRQSWLTGTLRKMNFASSWNLKIEAR